MRWLDRLLCGLSGHDYIKDFSRSDATVIRLHGVCIKCGHWTKGWSWPRTSKTAAGVVLLIGLASAGCDADVSGAGGRGDIKEITLRDGTRCAVLIGSHKGAISCAWGLR